MKTLIIEDNEIEAENLKVILESFEECQIIGAANSLEQGLALAKREQPRLILLDIQMECENSLEHLHQLDYDPYVVCCTLHEEYALQAYEVGVHGYLTKPITHEKLEEAFSRFLCLSKAMVEDLTEQTITLKKGCETYLVPIKDIIQIRADGDYSVVRDKEGAEFLSTCRMGEWRKVLPGSLFISLDRSTILNRGLIVSFSNLSSERLAKVTFSNGATCKIGAAALKRLKVTMGC